MNIFVSCYDDIYSFFRNSEKHEYCVIIDYMIFPKVTLMNYPCDGLNCPYWDKCQPSVETLVRKYQCSKRLMSLISYWNNFITTVALYIFSLLGGSLLNFFMILYMCFIVGEWIAIRFYCSELVDILFLLEVRKSVKKSQNKIRKKRKI